MTNKLPASESLKHINEKLVSEFDLFPLDSPDRTKGQAFAVGGQGGKQFLLVLGDEKTGGAKQTRIITEKIQNPPHIKDIEFSQEISKSARVNQQSTSQGFDNRLKNGNQSSFFVSDLDALTQLIRWYAV